MTGSIAFDISYGVLWLLVIVETALLIGLVRVMHELQQQGAGLGGRHALTGEEVPSFEAVDTRGGSITNHDVADRVMLFVATDCPACVTTLDELHVLEHKGSGVVLVCNGDQEDCERLTAERRLEVPLIVDVAQSLAKKFQVSAYPTAVIIDEDGRIARYGAPSRDRELTDLVNEDRHAHADPDGD